MVPRALQVRQRTDALDALGNTTAATGKGFAIGSAVLTALALLSAFEKEVAGGGGQLSADIVLDRMVRCPYGCCVILGPGPQLRTVQGRLDDRRAQNRS